MNIPKCKLVKCLSCFLLLTSVMILCFLYLHLNTFSTSWVNTDVKLSDEKLYICPMFKGRLGNTMFQYAAAYGIASELEMRVCLPRNSLIARTFKVDGDIFEDAPNMCSKFRFYRELDTNWAMYNQSFLDEISRIYNVCIDGYFQSYKYFNHVKDAMQKQFLAFNDETIMKSKTIIHEIRQHYLAKQNGTNVTLIGVHVRRGDSLSDDEVQLGRKVAPKEYFIKTIAYFNSKYNNPVFVVCGENQTWARQTVPSIYNAVFLNQSFTPDVDLAILTMCDHMIVSIGTYSWWAAYLNSGEIVYYKDWLLPGSFLYKGFKHEDYFPPEWVPM